MLSNAYFLTKFRYDTAENEPAKNLQKFANISNFANARPGFGQLPLHLAAKSARYIPAIRRGKGMVFHDLP